MVVRARDWGVIAFMTLAIAVVGFTVYQAFLGEGTISGIFFVAGILIVLFVAFRGVTGRFTTPGEAIIGIGIAAGIIFAFIQFPDQLLPNAIVQSTIPELKSFVGLP